VVVEAPHVTLTEGAQISSLTSGTGQGGTVRVTASDTFTLAGTSPDGRFRSGLFASTQGTGAGDAGGVVVEAPRVALMGGAQISSSTSGAGQGGTVTVVARDTITLTGQSSQGNPSGVFGNALAGTGGGGMVLVSAPHIEMAGSRIQVNSAAATSGPAGNIRVEADTLRLTGGAQISSNTSSAKQGGTVTVVARDTITLAGTSPDGGTASGLFAAASGAGDAGSVVVEAPRVALTGGAEISSRTSGAGQGGTVRVTASDTLTLAGRSLDGRFPSGLFANTQGTGADAGDAGSVVVEAPRVALTGGAEISSSTSSAGQGGTVRVTASDTFTLAGTSPDGRFRSGLFASTQGTGAGDAGSVVVEAPRVTLTEGAQISSSTSGTGQGGTVTVTMADVLTITGRNSGLRTTATSSGRGGDITLQAQQVRLMAGASISAESTGTRDAGNITITVGDTFVSQHSKVTTAATQADGGNIQITAPHLLRLRDSAITAEVGGGAQTVGGNITIDPQFVLLQNSQIIAQAFQGRGGNIQIQAQQVFLMDPASTVSASSALGINGQVNIQAPVTSLSGSVAPLPESFARATELLSSRCAERLREGTVSRFVLGGRDGVPLEPGSVLPSPLMPIDHQSPTRSEPMPHEQHGDSGAVWRIDNLGPAQGRGQYTQTRWPGGLNVECARWLEQQRTTHPSPR
jgi:large exoprotein involved in heme utilization and adhesion